MDTELKDKEVEKDLEVSEDIEREAVEVFRKLLLSACKITIRRIYSGDISLQ